MGKACCDVVNRGWAFDDGKLIYNLLDDHTVAVDVQHRQGGLAHPARDVDHGITITMAPLVVKGKV